MKHGSRSSVFGGLKKKDDKGKDFPPPGPIALPSQREVHSAIIATSPPFELNAADIRERRNNRSGTVGTPEPSKASNTGSIRGKKGASGGTTRSMLSPRGISEREGQEHKNVRAILPELLRGLQFKETDVFEIVSLAVQKMYVTEVPSYDKVAFENLKRAHRALGALIEEERRARAATVIQSLVRMRIERKKYQEIKSGPVTPYLIALSNMLKTEQDYFNKLSLSIKNYKEPLLAKNIIDNQTTEQLFVNIETIRSLHGRILQHLITFRTTESMWAKIPSIGSFFLFIAPSMAKAYSEFAKDYALTMEKIDSLQGTNAKFESFLMEATRNSAKQNAPLLLQIFMLPLSHIHNVTTYLEKLSDIAQEQSHIDDIMCALAIFQQTSVFVDKKRDELYYETQMIRLSKKILCEQSQANQQINNLFNGSRRLLKEGELTSDKGTKRQVFLLNDMCLITRPNVPATNFKTYTLEKIISLEGCQFSEVPTFDGGRRYLQKGTDALGFEFKNHEGTHRLFAATPEEKALWAKEIKANVDLCNKTRVFGLPLEVLLEREGRMDSGVPMIVERLVNAIRASGMKEEGLMRVSGVISEVNQLRQYFDKGEGATVSLANYNMPTLCSLLKLYFRELPDPIIPFDLYDPLIALQEQENLELDERLTVVRGHFKKVPVVNKKLLKYIMEFLVAIATCSAINKMSPQNLSIVMTPGLIRAKTQTTKTALQAPVANSLTELLIEFYEDVLGLDSDDTPINKRLTNEEYKTRSVQFKRLSVHFKQFQKELEDALRNGGQGQVNNPFWVGLNH
eukprot:TRINITY_DN3756_c0_g1_i1.p1 TRINITY_DN3756_c0_g1~~TRINITY_DN3756_c0_g1_i1.p1  ORF type:complete len:796 (+),score=161.88 TRINITY_DN3756_c0_g1_i1:193-2580(+)